MLKVTREMVLKGSDLRIEVSADEYGEGHVFVVAPPDTGDMAEARALRLKHLAIKGSAEVDVNRLFEGGGIDLSKIDLASAQRGLDEARFHLVAQALSKGQGEQWTVKDVKRIKPEVFSRIWETVDTISGFSSEAEEQIKGFRRARKGKR